MNKKPDRPLVRRSLVVGALLLAAFHTALAFNPQPEPPATERAAVKTMEPLDKTNAPAALPPSNKMRKAIDPVDDGKPEVVNPQKQR